MSDLGVSVLVLVGAVMACEGARRAGARLLSGGACAAEFISTLQLSACTLELKLLGDAGVSRPQLLALALTYGTSVIQALTSRGATCNPSGALERFVHRERGEKRGGGEGGGALALVTRVACQFAGAIAARVAVQQVWARGLSEMHARHREDSFRCASPVARASLIQATAVELMCAFAVHATASCTRGLSENYRVHAVAAVITATAWAGWSWGSSQFQSDPSIRTES